NWRGWLGTPGITDDESAQLLEILQKTRDSAAWKDALERNKWTDVWLTGQEFAEFVEEATSRVEKLLKELGLSARRRAHGRATSAPGPGGRADRDSSFRSSWGRSRRICSSGSSRWTSPRMPRSRARSSSRCSSCSSATRSRSC